MGELKTPGCLSVLLPSFGLASAGGFVGFFGGFWVLPTEWWGLGVVAGVAGGAVAGALLGRRDGRLPADDPDADLGTSIDDQNNTS